MVGRNGYHILCPFECDLCIFRKLRRADPKATSEKDKELLVYIRRMNLDALWSRATATVNGNRDKAKKMVEVGLQGPFVHESPFPEHDHCGYEVALEMLKASKAQGKSAKTHLQFDTIRQFPTVFGNQLRARPKASGDSWGLVDVKGHYRRMANDPCSSLWFTRFKEGCKRRMGSDWNPNQAMTPDLVKAVLDFCEDRIAETDSKIEVNRWTMAHTYVVIAYVLSMRGPEGFLLDLEATNRYWGNVREDPDLVYVCLRGKVKGDHGEICHVLPCVILTSSGINVKDSVGRLLSLKRSQGFDDGPAISSVKGIVLLTYSVNDCLVEALCQLFESSPELFSTKVTSLEQVRKVYHIYRSLRRSSDSKALDMEVSGEDIDIVNRWEGVERAQGNRPNRSMKHHYADIVMLIKPFKRYTFAM